VKPSYARSWSYSFAPHHVSTVRRAQQTALSIPTDPSSRFKSPSTALRDRSALLGVTPPASGRSSPFTYNPSGPSGQRYADDLEGQNDEALEGLAAKVKLLKDVSRALLSDPTKRAQIGFLAPRSRLGSETRSASRRCSSARWCVLTCRCADLALLTRACARGRTTHSLKPRASSLARFAA